MTNCQSLVLENIAEEKYLALLTKLYPQHNLKSLLLLNIDLRLLYLKHIFMIENSLKHVLLNQLFIDDIQNVNNGHYLDEKKNKKLESSITFNSFWLS